ncbi:hypothetical protein [Erwinia sp. 9145]|uniref:hypothetical protein n=1 Tax=Erwinia sp. 9145 TaxID=1500895 RepID=UPI000557757B|nr:hypothetical protein [Erwinia sp. 9145]
MLPATGSSQAEQALANPPKLTPFGKQVDSLVSKSPTLSRDLDTLDKRRWLIKEGPAGKGTFADRSNKSVNIDSNELTQPERAVQALSHEIGYALYTPETDLTSKEAYLNSALSDEGAATLKNIEVQREILKNGGNDISIAGNSANKDSYNMIYDKMVSKSIGRKTAEEQIGRIFGKGEVTSTTGDSYEKYYGGWYDKTYPNK